MATRPMPEFLDGSFFRGRAGFTYPVETYSTWIVLGCLEGRFEFALGEDEWRTCESGEFVVCPPGVPLRRKTPGRISFYHLRLKWRASRDAGGLYSPADRARFESTLYYLQKVCLRTLDAPSQSLANHLLNDLLFQRTFATELQKPEPASPDPLMQKAAELLKKELREPDNLERLAERLSISPSQLSRRFTAAFGVTPVVYRTKLRIDRSKQLLLESNNTLDLIAEECGFDNAFYLSRVFSREVGESPRDFRKKRRV